MWVVGASSGIGAALAKELVNRGACVAISARRERLLREVAGEAMLVVPLDITDDAATDAAAARVRQHLGGLDLVIHSAGLSQPMDVEHWDRSLFDACLALNLGGLNSLLGAVLPILLEQKHGRLVGIASLAGWRGFPGAQAYTASKAAQINLLEGLRAALLPHGVAVTTICPGFVRSEMTQRNDFPMPLLLEADRAAALICDGLQRQQAQIVFPATAGLAMRAAQMVPTGVWSWALAALGLQAQAHRKADVDGPPNVDSAATATVSRLPTQSGGSGPGLSAFNLRSNSACTYATVTALPLGERAAALADYVPLPLDYAARPPS